MPTLNIGKRKIKKKMGDENVKKIIHDVELGKRDIWIYFEGVVLYKEGEKGIKVLVVSRLFAYDIHNY